MSEHPSSPPPQPEAPAEPTSERPQESIDSDREDEGTEATSLLHNHTDDPTADSTNSTAASSSRSLRDWEAKKRKWRWPSIIALSLLIAVVIVILGLGFAAPAVMETYAKEATVFEPSGLSIDSFTSTGVKARIRGDFKLDGSRVHKKSVRDLGRAAAWIARAIESRESTVEVYLPEYDDVLLGTAIVPPIKVNIRDRVTTHVDFVTDLSAGDIDGLKHVANDWIKGSIKSLNVRGIAIVPLKSGIFYLGTQSLSEEIIFGQDELPAIPQYNISRLNFHEVEIPSAGNGMEADVSVTLSNKYPVRFTIPPLGFTVKVPGCLDQHINVADAFTKEIHVEPKQDVFVQVNGLIRKLPDTLTSICPKLLKSPLDKLLGDYMNGDDLTIYISGSDDSLGNTPQWISDFLKDIIVPVDFHGETFDNLIRDFSLTDVHFGLPDPFSGPDSPDSQPRVSATIKALIGLPDEMNFSVNVSQVRANAVIYYHHKQLGLLDLRKWQKAKSKRVEAKGDEKPGLAVSSFIKDAPIDITNNSLFAELIQAVVFGGKKVNLGVKAAVDVETRTVLGKLVVRDIPAKGEVFVNPIAPVGKNQTGFLPKIGNLRLVDTAKSWIKLAANVNFTNPTNYSATVPYFNIKLLNNGTELGNAYAMNVTVGPGNNSNISIEAVWKPIGEKGAAQGREVLSQYISGYNTTLTLQTHAGTVPNQPALGLALARFPIDIPAPSLHTPRNPDKPGEPRDPDSPNFIDDAVFHIFTSRATFTILSPLPTSSIWVTYLDATALYNHTETVGKILYDLPWEIPPGVSTSPALPVAWSLDSVGYDALKDAVGGRLKLDARANASIRVGTWEEKLWIQGRGIGAHIRF